MNNLTATTNDRDGIYILADGVLIVENGNYISMTSKARLVVVSMQYPHLEVIDRDPTAKEITKIIGMGYKQNTEDKRRFWALDHHMIDCAYGGYQLQVLTNQGGGVRSITSGYVSAKDLYLQICNYRFDRPD
jgi:hypothetical protein